jgi:hypothetical protein
MLSIVIILNYEFHHNECHFAECNSTECHFAKR